MVFIQRSTCSHQHIMQALQVYGHSHKWGVFILHAQVFMVFYTF